MAPETRPIAPSRSARTGDPPATARALPAPAPAPAAGRLVATGMRELYVEAYEPMVRLAYLVVGDASAAEEVVQEAFVRVHARWRTVDNPGGYLRIAVLNGARNELRRRSAARRLKARQSAERPPPAGLDHATAELVDALDVLSPRQRAVVVLRFYEGASEAQIAEALGMRPGTVKSTLHRALARLREVIEP